MANNKDIKIIIDLQTKNQRALTEIQHSLQNLGKTSTQAKGASEDLFGTFVKGNVVASMLTGAFNSLTSAITNTAKSLATLGIETAGQLEQIEIALTGITGSASQAEAILNQIKMDASKTPFSLKDLASLNQMMMSTGLSFKESNSLIMGMGDALAFAGKGTEELNRIVVNLQQIKNLGYASAIDLKQFAFAGIDIYGMLAESMGKSREEIAKMDATSITFDMISEAIAKASGEGGKFNGAMLAQSTTLVGLQSTFQDTIAMLSSDIMTGSGIFGILKEGAVLFMQALEEMKPTLMLVATIIGQTLKMAFEQIKIVIENVKAKIDENREGFNLMVNQVSIGIQLIIGFFVGLFTIASEVFMGMIELNQKFLEGTFNMAQKIGKAYNWIVDTATSMAIGIAESIASAINSVLDSIEKLVNGALQMLKPMIGALNKIPGVNIPLDINLGNVSAGSFKASATGIGRGLKSTMHDQLMSVMGATQAMGKSGLNLLGFASTGEEKTFEDILNAGSGGGSAGGGAGSGSGDSGGKSEAEKLAEEQEKIALESLKKLEDARVDAIEDEDKRRIAQIKLDAQREIEAFKGTEEQKAQYRRLVNARADREIDAIKQAKRDKELKEEEKLAQDKMEIQKQQMAENINFYNVRDVDDALARLESFANSKLSSQLLNFNLGS